jgi:hypothetical protein
VSQCWDVGTARKTCDNVRKANTNICRLRSRQNAILDAHFSVKKPQGWVARAGGVPRTHGTALQREEKSCKAVGSSLRHLHNGGCLPPFFVTQPPLLIREVERLAKERGWSTAQLAKQLNLSGKAFRNVCVGHRILSLGLLANIIDVFGKVRSVRELAIHYLANEYKTYRRSRRDTYGVIAAIPASASTFRRWQIAEWVVQIPTADGVRRGLFLTSSDTALLRRTVRALGKELCRAGVSVMTLQAHAQVKSSERTLAVETGVLIVERLDRASEAIARIIEERGNAFRPVVVTSMGERDAIPDMVLVRTLRAITTTVTLTPHANTTPTGTHTLTPSTSHVSS